MQSTPVPVLVWVGNYLILPAVAWLWSLTLVVLAEFAKALAAAHCHERLKYTALQSHWSAAANARWIYLEFYSDTQLAHCRRTTSRRHGLDFATRDQMPGLVNIVASATNGPKQWQA